MRVEKKIKNYADDKMEALKDGEFFKSINDSHFTESKKPKSSPKWIAAIATSCVLVLTVIVTLSLTIQNFIGYNSSQYLTKESTLTELNGDCTYFQFAEEKEISVTSVYERSTDVKLFYDVALNLNDGSHIFSFICVINNDYNYTFESYEQYKQYGTYTINYNATSISDENNGAFIHEVCATLLTDKERLEIRYSGRTADEKNMFFELLSSILVIK